MTVNLRVFARLLIDTGVPLFRFLVLYMPINIRGIDLFCLIFIYNYRQLRLRRNLFLRSTVARECFVSIKKRRSDELFARYYFDDAV